ncbi:hypothetical protein ACIQU6_08640 [Streptomyces sp. NPDC090442]|uniref:hypothetical protein n=1 Tax=Streptomyces sp. NPDC090442 TaxID=3365962 RepID=UPI0038085675
MGELNEAEIRALGGELEALCASVDDMFARPAARENLTAMVHGPQSEVPRKNTRQLAEFTDHPNPDRLQGFRAKAAWDADELRDRVRAYAIAALAGPATDVTHARPLTHRPIAGTSDRSVTGASRRPLHQVLSQTETEADQEPGPHSCPSRWCHYRCSGFS